ncbi:MAG: hypothetical protein GX117_09600 [Candidatus Hydrogenedentes bacterium]|jgi:hypothetical protein|nr:hypothetical protein [Candidatus Hydrogenedentota bacterium]
MLHGTIPSENISGGGQLHGAFFLGHISLNPKTSAPYALGGRRHASQQLCIRRLFVVMFLMIPIVSGASVTQAESSLRNAQPTEEFVYSQLIASGLSGDELRNQYMEWLKAQEPFISRENLLKIISAKSASLQDGFCKFSVNTTSYNSGISFQRTIEWVFSGEKVLRDEYGYDDDIDQLISWRLAYNGRYNQQFNRSRNTGTIMPFR